jgi:hypothetical protein
MLAEIRRLVAVPSPWGEATDPNRKLQYLDIKAVLVMHCGRSLTKVRASCKLVGPGGWVGGRCEVCVRGY